MEHNQRNNNSSEGMDQQNNVNNESLNTASNMREELQKEQDGSGSGRSYDYGAEGSGDEAMNEQLGRNSNQQTVSNPISTPGTGNDNLPGQSGSRAGTGSGMTTKQSITGSDFDGQNRNS